MEHQGHTFSPPPPPRSSKLATPGAKNPQRRADDVPTSNTEWSVLLVALLTWASTYLVDLSQYDTWNDLFTPKVIMVKLGQLAGVMVSVFTAKRMR